jgi:uncharacterized membrane protein YGL010W
MRVAIDLLSQYAEYHRDRRNIASHFIGVPMIVFGVGALLAKPAFVIGTLALSPAWVVFALAAAWYLTRGDLVLGVAVTGAMALLMLLAHKVAAGGLWPGLAWGVAFFAVGWVIQFVGHWYEGRKPAFVDDIVGLLVGPMFVTAEALFALGWNKPMLAQIEQRVGPTHLRDIARIA